MIFDWIELEWNNAKRKTLTLCALIKLRTANSRHSTFRYGYVIMDKRRKKIDSSSFLYRYKYYALRRHFRINVKRGSNALHKQSIMFIMDGPTTVPD